jgi:hypothetical protein
MSSSSYSDSPDLVRVPGGLFRINRFTHASVRETFANTFEVCISVASSRGKTSTIVPITSTKEEAEDVLNGIDQHDKDYRNQLRNEQDMSHALDLFETEMNERNMKNAQRKKVLGILLCHLLHLRSHSSDVADFMMHLFDWVEQIEQHQEQPHVLVQEVVEEKKTRFKSVEEKVLFAEEVANSVLVDMGVTDADIPNVEKCIKRTARIAVLKCLSLLILPQDNKETQTEEEEEEQRTPVII